MTPYLPIGSRESRQCYLRNGRGDDDVGIRWDIDVMIIQTEILFTGLTPFSSGINLPPYPLNVSGR